MLKEIFSPVDKKLLGGHHLGELSPELVHIGMHAIFDDDAIYAFIMAVYNYPTLSDAYKYQVRAGTGIPSNLISW
jgi:NAD(P) transhydrogenase